MKIRKILIAMLCAFSVTAGATMMTGCDFAMGGAGGSEETSQSEEISNEEENSKEENSEEESFDEESSEAEKSEEEESSDEESSDEESAESSESDDNTDSSENDESDDNTDSTESDESDDKTDSTDSSDSGESGDSTDSSDSDDSTDSEDGEDDEDGGYVLEYEYYYSGYRVIGKGTFDGTDLVIPAEYQGLPVVGIAGGAFSECTTLVSVFMPATVTSLESEVFVGISTLESVTVDENNAYFSSIDGNLYNKDGTKLIRYMPAKTATEFEVADTVTEIGWKAFYQNSILQSVTVSESVTKINTYAFAYTRGLKSAVIEGAASFGTSVFQNASALESVTINGAASIGKSAFSSCSKLTDVSLAEGVTFAGTDSTDLTYIFKDCSALESISLPGSTGKIYGWMFANCSNLKTVVLGEGITHIYNDAFLSCDLGTVVLPSTISYIHSFGLAVRNYTDRIYYNGTAETRANINYTGNSLDYICSVWYYYLEDTPTDSGDYWRFVDGEAKPWRLDTNDATEANSAEVVKTISTAEELVAFANEVTAGTSYDGQAVCLGADINMQGVEYSPACNFEGVFDGNGYSITNLYLYDEGASISLTDGNWVEYGATCVGLFGNVKDATIRNLTLSVKTAQGFYTDKELYMGALVGYADGVRIENCSVSSDIYVNVQSGSESSGAIAGLIAYSLDAYVSNVTIECYIDYMTNCYEAHAAAVLGAGNVRVYDSDIYGSVKYQGKHYGHTGMIIGRERTDKEVTISTMYDSVVSGSIRALDNNTDSQYVGEIVGQGGLMKAPETPLDVEDYNEVSVSAY